MKFKFLLLYFIFFSSLLTATELKHWPKPESAKINNLIKNHANQGQYAVFDMDNTVFMHDLTESLLAYLEQQKILNRENLDPSLKIIPFNDINGEHETLVSYYYRLCSIDQLICYPWIAQSFAGLNLRILKENIDALLKLKNDIKVKVVVNNKLKQIKISPPQIMHGMQELFNKLQENGIEVYIVSAANEVIARMLVSDPKYGYNVKPQNVFGVDLLLKNTKTGVIISSRKLFKNKEHGFYPDYDNWIITPYIITMPWFAGKVATVLEYISQWQKPLLVGGDTPYSDTYMLLNLTNTGDGGIKLFINKNDHDLKKLKIIINNSKKNQQDLNLKADADKNWIIIKQKELK